MIECGLAHGHAQFNCSRIVDLTIPIESNYPGIPGSATPPPKLETITVINEAQRVLLEAEGVDVKKDVPVTRRSMISTLFIGTHSGTHIDAPRHLFEKGESVDQISLEKIVKEAVLIKLTHKGPNSTVSAKDVLDTGVEFGPDVIPVIYTGWTEKMAGKPGFWEQVPYLEPDVGELMVKKGVTAVAMDLFPEKARWRVPLEPGEVRGINHLTLLGKGIIIIQFLTNLSQIGKDRFLLVALPLKLKGVDGSPARVIALVE